MPTEETKTAVLEVEVKHLNEKAVSIQNGIDIINAKLDDKYATKEELQSLRDDHIFWRNILVAIVSASLILSVGTVISLLSKAK